MKICITRTSAILPDSFRQVEASVEKQLSLVSGELLTDRSSPFFPERSDEKVMREDVKASVVAARQMLADYDKQLLEETDLFVANGIFIEDTGKQLQRMIEVYRALGSDVDMQEKVRRLYQATPPLLALQTLTNSTMSFVSQYTGIKGNNATFGNTSLSAFHALEKAVAALEAGSERALVCASSGGGVVSFMTFQSFFDDREGWKESGAAVCLFLEKNKPGTARITGLRSNQRTEKQVPAWEELRIDDRATHTIFSGAFTRRQYETDLGYCSGFAKNVFSFFPQYGNLGPAGPLLAVTRAQEIIAADPSALVDIFDRDPYGCESYIRIGA